MNKANTIVCGDCDYFEIDTDVCRKMGIGVSYGESPCGGYMPARQCAECEHFQDAYCHFDGERIPVGMVCNQYTTT